MFSSFIALKDPINAGKLLARRSDQASLRCAAHVCLAANEIEAGRTYALKFMLESHMTGNWADAVEISQLHNCLQVDLYL